MAWFDRAAPTLALFACALALSCDADKPPSSPPHPPQSSAKAPSVASSPPASAGPQIDLVQMPATDEDVAPLVRREAERARADGRDLLVYVGAPWCEPCTRFHEAAARGELDAVLPPIRLLEFDRDRDEARLGAAGYLSKLIPLFAVPAADGTSSPLRLEGSIKGEGAVLQIVPRLQALLVESHNLPR